MAQAITHTPTLSNSEIIKTVTEIEWREAGYSGEPIIPSLEQIQAFTEVAPDNGWVVFVLERPKATRYDVRSIDEDTKRLDLSQRIWSQPEAETPEAQIGAMTNIGAIAEYLRQDFYEVDPAHFEPMANFMKRTAGEPVPARLQWIHKAWEKADEDNPELEIPHPLSTIIRAWLHEQTSTPITRADDRKRPFAILKNPMGSVRELAFTERDMGQVFKAPERIDQIQMELNLGDTPTILPAIMPLQVVRTTNLKAQTRSGAVSHELRIFFEAMMALQPNQQRADLMFRLGDLIDFLYPNGKFHWTNQMPHIERALGVLNDNATVPWIDDQGDLREWTPVVIPSLLPNKPTRDTPIFVQVTMPPDAEQGYLVIKNVGRLKGMKSGPQWNAYHVACYLWDKHATIKGILIDPTRPIDRRNEKGEIVGADGKPILTARGKPITNLYHDRVIAQGEREDSPASDRYRVLTSEDLILACFPNGYPTNNRREYLRRAKAHWRQMEVDGDITIKVERSGWRILPTAKHLNAYRALNRAKKAVY